MIRSMLSRLSLMLVLVLALTACGPKEDPPAGSQDQSQAAASTVAPVPPEPEPEPEPVLPFVNPLTGEGCATDIGRNRPIAIMLNDHQKAMPQLGVSQADIIYEMPAEGGITRMMALFQSMEGVGNIGTVRSARDYYVSMAYGHDAIFLHAGGSPQAYQVIKDWGITALDCVNGPYEGTLFWRDQWRKKNRGLEHSVLTSGDTISQLLPTYKRVRLEHKEDFSLPLAFLEPDELPQGEPASSVTVTFSKYKTGVFTYDPETGLYLVEQFGGPYVDGNTQKQVGVKNVLVLQTDVGSVKGDDKGRKTLRTTGSGSGWLLCGGKVQDIRWEKASHKAPMSFTGADGAPLRLGVGHSYINILDDGCSVVIAP